MWLPGPPWWHPAPVSSRHLDGLHPAIRGLATRLLELAKQRGKRVGITSGLRSLDEQAILYAQGRTTPGPIVTHAKPGQSWHNFGLAFDVAPLNAAGKPDWSAPERTWFELGELGETIGLSWGGRWSGFRDLPHFEYHRGVTLAEAQAGKRPAVPPAQGDSTVGTIAVASATLVAAAIAGYRWT